MNFGFNDLFLFIFFFFLVLGSLIQKRVREYYIVKSLFDWFIDLTNLSLQGLIVPWLQLTIISSSLFYLLPEFQSIIGGGFIGGFLINLLIVDYLYYWNHRILHSKKFFPIHSVHHSVTEFDVFATSKNTIWTTFFIVYLWGGGVFLYLLKDPTGYLFGVVITGILDLWKHSRMEPSSHKMKEILSTNLCIMRPAEHSFHHGRGLKSNYGAIFNLWDKLHGTYQFQEEFVPEMGTKLNLSKVQMFLFPFRRRRI